MRRAGQSPFGGAGPVPRGWLVTEGSAAPHRRGSLPTAWGTPSLCCGSPTAILLQAQREGTEQSWQGAEPTSW